MFLFNALAGVKVYHPRQDDLDLLRIYGTKVAWHASARLPKQVTLPSAVSRLGWRPVSREQVSLIKPLPTVSTAASVQRLPQLRCFGRPAHPEWSLLTPPALLQGPLRSAL